MGANLAPLDIPQSTSRFAHVACGVEFTCVLDTAGNVFCFGAGALIGYGDGNNRGNGSAAPYDMASLPPLPLDAPAVLVSASLSAACALMQTGVVACFANGDSPSLLHSLKGWRLCVFFCPSAT